MRTERPRDSCQVSTGDGQPTANASGIREVGAPPLAFWSSRYWKWSMSAFRILIADDHEIVRRGIRALLENHPGWEVCGEAIDGRDAIEKAAALRPDLALLDVGMPNLNGLDAARQILAAAPRTRVLILTMHESEQIVREVLEVGARGFLLKTDAARDMVSAVEALQRRTTFFTSSVAELVLNGYLHRRDNDKPLRDRLTPREREVVQL